MERGGMTVLCLPTQSTI